MTTQELEELVQQIQETRRNSQTLEVKDAFIDCPLRMYDTISSFSNQEIGGTIVFGIDEKQDFKIVGVYDPQDLQKKINAQCNEMQPTVRPLLTVLKLDDKFVVSAEIPGLDINQRPCYYKGAGITKGSYIRIGDSDEPMTAGELYDIDSFNKHLDAETDILSEIKDEDINQEALQKYVAILCKDRPNVSKLHLEKILSLKKIKIDGKYTVLANLIFGLYPDFYMRSTCIKAVSIPGIRQGVVGVNGERFLDNQSIVGTIKEQLDKALEFVDQNTKHKTVIDSKTGQRNDIGEYPIVALREAILNALEHRDYSIYSRSIPTTIEIYYDRIEISNPGELFGRFTIDKLGTITDDTRNPNLVEAGKSLRSCTL